MRAMTPLTHIRSAIVIVLLTGAGSHAGAQWLTDGDRGGVDGCTIGVASGRVTADGRPLLWKVRDTDAPNNEVRWQVAEPYSFLGVFNADGESPWMAVNSRGFALLNANSLDLPGSGNPGNGVFMRRAMAECATVADFQRLLDSTNNGGRRTQAHFAVIDTTGAAALFETGTGQYWKYDACDPSVTDGYVIRTNFALHGGGSVGILRYRRSQTIIAALRQSNDLSPRGLIQRHMRDFSDAAGNPFPIPYPARAYPGAPFGSIETASSICGATSVSAAVIQGVGSGEPAILTTMWTQLGLPAASMAVPYWPAGPTPAEADGTPTAPLCDEANRLQARLYRFIPDPVSGRVGEYLDSYALRTMTGEGIWKTLLPAEETVFQKAEERLAEWRERSGSPRASEVLATEGRLAAFALAVMRLARIAPDDKSDDDAVPVSLAQNYPNPANGGTTIRFTLREHARVRLTIHDILGRTVTGLLDEERPAGENEAWFNTAGLSSGMYWYRLSVGAKTLARRLLVVK
jgi:hypothetical protein